jgi:hypothetical protein
MRYAPRAERKVSFSPGWIATGSGDLTSCTIIDISEGGAKLKTPKAASLPGRLRLYLSPAAHAFRDCVIRWRTDDRIGVQFAVSLAVNMNTPTAFSSDVPSDRSVAEATPSPINVAVYFKKAEQFEDMARGAGTETAKMAYEHLAWSYRQLAIHASRDAPQDAELPPRFVGNRTKTAGLRA